MLWFKLIRRLMVGATNLVFKTAHVRVFDQKQAFHLVLQLLITYSEASAQKVGSRFKASSMYDFEVDLVGKVIINVAPLMYKIIGVENMFIGL